jgi:hypothetical protein
MAGSVGIVADGLQENLFPIQSGILENQADMKTEFLKNI